MIILLKDKFKLFVTTILTKDKKQAKTATLNDEKKLLNNIEHSQNSYESVCVCV